MKTTQDVVLMLNKAAQMDPGAIHVLLCNRIPCKKELGESGVCIIPNIAIEGEHHVIGLIGVINGVLSTLGLNKIGIKVLDGKFDGFIELENE